MKVVVVGAGVFGASVAYHLAREGAEVVVFDRDDAGRATSAGAGIVCPWLSAREDEGWLPLAFGAGRYYPQLVQDLAAEGETVVHGLQNLRRGYDDFPGKLRALGAHIIE